MAIKIPTAEEFAEIENNYWKSVEYKFSKDGLSVQQDIETLVKMRDDYLVVASDKDNEHCWEIGSILSVALNKFIDVVRDVY